MRVVVPFGKRSLSGYILGLGSVSHHGAPKPIEALADEPPLLLPTQVDLARWMAHHYHAPLTDAVRAMIPPGVRSLRMNSKRPRGPRVQSRIRGLAATARPSTTLEMSSAQAAAIDAIAEALQQRRGRLLLHGVTGSGKTEVYLEAIDRCLRIGLGVIVLIPEISLTPQVTSRFAERFAGTIATMHSRITESERAEEWRRIRAGDARVAVGPRAAIFAPVTDLGLIIVDEEHSPTYKQQRVPRYHAVDVAHKLADLSSAVTLLGSATPTVTSYYFHGRAENGYAAAGILELPRRYSGEPLPAMEVADMRRDEGWSLSRPLGERLLELCAEELEREGQVILYLNRRGLAWYARCRRCGESIGCPNCTVSLVYHGSTRRLSCHYCGHSEALPQKCPACGARELRPVGFGTERIEAEVRRCFPQARVARLDRDTVKTRDSYFALWEDFAAGRADVMVGTALVSRGWDLPRVGLVGVIDADQSLHYPDYRAAEDTFATLVQVGGRARRSGARVLVQTMNPHHYAIRFGLAHDYHGFFAEEVRVREALNFPPFTRLVEVMASHKTDERARQLAEGYVDTLRERLESNHVPVGPGGVTVLGPGPAFIHRLRGEYRWSLTIKARDLDPLLPLLPDARGFTIDVDPI
jgi:primosomal protein N' (replication factor Y)